MPNFLEIIRRRFLDAFWNNPAIHIHRHVDPTMPELDLELAHGAALANEVIRERVAKGVAIEMPSESDLLAHLRESAVVGHHGPGISC